MSAVGSKSMLNLQETTGEDFIVALSDRDSERLEACLHPEARMRALIPPGFEEFRGPSDIVARLLSWFSDAESIQVLEKNVYTMADRLQLSYRFREHYSDGSSDVIEQKAYCDVRNGTIVAMDLLCSGPRSETPVKGKGAQRFDAGDLGCSSGLPEEFQRRIEGIPIGSNLEIVTRDPSAKEDLPSLSRLLGHRVVSVSNQPDGSALLIIQRGR
jgi:TusA-related sulfurtransferase